MSVILVVLPGAPTIDEELQKKEKELNKNIGDKIKGESLG